MRRSSLQSGFTLIELTMAMAVFSFMLVIIMIGFIGVARQHQSGLAARATQQNARLALAQLSQAIQRGSDATVVNTYTTYAIPYQRICLKQAGPTLVYEVRPVTIGGITINQLSQGYLPADQPCSGSVLSTNQYLTDATVNVTKFLASVVPANGTSLGAVSLSLSVASAYAATGDLNASGTQCVAGASSFCSVTSSNVVSAMRGGIQQ